MRSSKALWVLIGLFLLLSISYMLVTPILESPDESSHLQVIHYISTRRKLTDYRLPEMTAKTGSGIAWLVSYHEEPLYYAPPLYHTIGALLTFRSPMTDLEARLVPNPAWERDWAPTRGTDAWNKNVFVHLPGETWRESPTVRAATTLRLFSLVCSVMTLVCAYHISLHILPEYDSFALGTVAVIALNPQFIASSVAVSNDPLTIALCSLGTYLMLRGLRLPEAKQLRHWLLLGVVTGIACLVKQSGLMLGPLAGLSLLLTGLNHRRDGKFPWKQVLIYGFRYGTIVLALSGWWYVRNAALYGDLMGTGPHYATDVALASFGLPELWDTFTSYWACFGWQVLNLSEWIYVLLLYGVLLALGTLLLKALHARRLWLKDPAFWQPVLILTALFGMNLVAFVRWAIATGAPYGRLLFPSIVPIALILRGGLYSFGERTRFWIDRMLLAGMLVLCALTPWLVIRPAFASPILTEPLPESLQAIMQDFSNGLTLLGYTEEHIAEHPDKTHELTLYWLANTDSDALVTQWAQFAALDAQQRVAEDTRWLGGTLYPSSFWRDGDIVMQRISLYLPDHIDTPSLYWLRTGLTEDSDAHIPVSGSDGNTFITLGPWAIRPIKTENRNAKPCTAIYDQSLCLSDVWFADDSNGIIVHLTWQALSTPGVDATLFVHAINSDGSLVAQADVRPKEGAFPTNVWREGDVITDTVRLETKDVARILIGWYDPVTGARLPAVNAQGETFGPDQAATVAVP